MFPRVGNSRLCSRETGVGNTLSLGLFWPSPWTPSSPGNALPTKSSPRPKKKGVPPLQGYLALKKLPTPRTLQ